MGERRSLDAVRPSAWGNVAGFPAFQIEKVHRHDVSRLKGVKS